MLGTRSGSQKFLKFESRAGTGFSMDKWCLVALSARILSIYAVFGACIVLVFFSVEIEGVKEQRVRIKFYLKLGRCVAETPKIKKNKKHLVMTLWLSHKSANGLTGLKMAERQTTMTNVLDELQSAQWRKMLQKCLRLSVRIVGE